MNFDPQGRVSPAFARWSLLRHAQQHGPTLREGSFSRLWKTRPFVYARIQFGPLASVCVRAVNWDAVMYVGVMAACFMAGMTAAGLILLEKAAR